jgi:dihydrofolate synthase/folylpolyglutamate synthase
MTYSQAVAFLDGLVNYEKLAGPRNEFKLDSIRRLLDLAGNPERKMRNVILVAGTKGKGSVCYMLDAALRGCGLSTGMFVSPHVLDVRERIQLDGKPIPKRLFALLVSRLAPFVSSVRPSSLVLRPDAVAVSYFELTTATAFLLFAERQPDYSVIEVGLGGRLDATNLSDPKVSVITRIGYDHIKVLGNTLRKIAGEKAGIMRKGRPVVIGDQEPEAFMALKRKAYGAGARLVQAASVVSVPSVRSVAEGLRLHVHCRFGAGRIRLPLLGQHQVENCRTALAVFNELSASDSRIDFSRVAHGMGTVSIPARCQVVRIPSLVPRPSSLVWIVDSCHNPESGRALANVLRDHLPFLRFFRRPTSRAPRPILKAVLVYGSLSGKLVAETVAPLAPYVEQAILVQPDNPRAMPLAELEGIFAGLHIPYVTANSVLAALTLAKKLAQAQAQAQRLQTATCKLQTSLPIVVAGSFYLAGEALRAIGPSRAKRRFW